MIVVFSINWSRMFALLVRWMCCKLELKTLNNRKMTALLQNHWKHRMCSDPCICTTQQSLFFQRSFAQNLKNISPIVWYCCNIWRPYKISNILYKTKEKAVSFLLITSGTSCDLSWMTSFSGPHGMSLFGNIERCVVVSFSGPTHCALFQEFIENIFMFSTNGNLGVWNTVLWKVASSSAKDMKPIFFIYLAKYSVKNFITTRQYLVNLTCNDVYSISSKTCQGFFWK